MFYLFNFSYLFVFIFYVNVVCNWYRLRLYVFVCVCVTVREEYMGCVCYEIKFLYKNYFEYIFFLLALFVLMNGLMKIKNVCLFVCM